MNIGTTIARELVLEFPETPTRSLAAKLYDENPSIYLNLEAARGSIRRGQTTQEDEDKSVRRPT